MHRFLNATYKAAGMFSAFLILAICLLISAQIVLNGMGRLMPGLLPSTIPSYADFAGFMLAGATFLAMAYTLRSGGHIRVNLVVQNLSPRMTLIAEFLTLAVASAFVGYALFFSVALMLESLHYSDVSNGIIPVPLWLTQSAMTFGIGLLLVALLHTLVDLITTGTSVLNTPDEV
ncbi:MAG: TRAP transporter small permease [Shimia sp.]|nr:TRAP transporter small permease [Shimia sp.]MCP4824468.1 TRAP transporter small permease [Shimia sp.]